MDFFIEKYGAVGDGKTLNTAAIQKAIDDCAAQGGGRVVVSHGIYMTGTIVLKSGVDLHIEADGTILGSPNCGKYDENSAFDIRPFPYNVIYSGDIADYGDYPDFPKKHVERANLPRNRGCCLIYAEESENVSITGTGKIDGNGTRFVEVAPKEANSRTKYRRIHAPTPPRIVFFCGCKNVKVEGITVTNAPGGWSFWVHDCDYVNFDKVKIDCDLDYPNNDGIHVNCSRNVTVSNCAITCSDDCIVVRANSRSLKENKPCEKITVTNCSLVSATAGIRVAYVCDGTIRNCAFDNLVITNSPRGVFLELPDKNLIQSDFGREKTLIENMRFSNIIMDNVSIPVGIHLFDGPQTEINAVRNLFFNGITARGNVAIIIEGTENTAVENVRFTDCNFETRNDGCRWRDYYNPFKFENVKNLALDGVNVTVSPRPKEQ